MNHQKIYNSIISKALIENRKKYDGVYYENHHIKPKCIKGTNDKENLVLLTAREHYVCHKLLTKLYPKNRSLIYAFHRLANDKQFGRKISSKDYQYLRELFNSMNIIFSKDHKKKMSKARKGKTYEEFYGDNAQHMKNQRKLQCSGKGNPNSNIYVIFNNKLNKSWIIEGNQGIFCKYYHVSGRTFQLSRKQDKFINGWKCEKYNSSNPNHQNIIRFSLPE